MPIFPHIVIVKKNGKWPDRPWQSHCRKCGNEGQFASQGEAVLYANLHVQRRGGRVEIEAEPQLKEELHGSGAQQEDGQKEDDGRHEDGEKEGQEVADATE